MSGYLDVHTLESDLPTGIFGQCIIDIASKYILIPSAKERGFAQQGIRFFTEV
jgi:hypothetical protein